MNNDLLHGFNRHSQGDHLLKKWSSFTLLFLKMGAFRCVRGALDE